MQDNHTMKILLTPKFIKVYIDNLTYVQRKMLDKTLLDVQATVTFEADGYIITAKPEKLYKALYTLCNSFSIELI